MIRPTRTFAAALCALSLGMALPAAAAPITAPVTGAAPADFSGVIEAVRPAVVSVRVQQTARGGREVPEQFREFFERFGGQGFELPGQQRPGARGMGSGFLVSDDGYIVTNNHVISDAETIEIILDDGRELTGRVIGSDDKTDLALVKVEASGLPYVAFGRTDDIKVGQWVVTLGAPFGLGGTATAGIVSAAGRDIGSGPYDDYLQIDAPINRGNSGGPAFNLRGEVVGVNTAIFSPTGGSVGVGFAIPADLAQQVIADLRDDGTVDRGWLGVVIQSLTPELAQGLGLAASEGALISDMQNNAPAALGGLQVGDVVTGLDGERIESARDLSRAVGGLNPGNIATLDVLRGGTNVRLAVTLGAQPGKEPELRRDASLGIDETPERKLGMALANGSNGPTIAAVRPGSEADEKGLEPGNVILTIGSETVQTAEAAIDAIRRAREAGIAAVALRVETDRGARFVALEL